jgi:hypothetical protein
VQDHSHSSRFRCYCPKQRYQRPEQRSPNAFRCSNSQCSSTTVAELAVQENLNFYMCSSGQLHIYNIACLEVPHLSGLWLACDVTMSHHILPSIKFSCHLVTHPWLTKNANSSSSNVKATWWIQLVTHHRYWLVLLVSKPAVIVVLYHNCVRDITYYNVWWHLFRNEHRERFKHAQCYETSWNV